MNEQLLQQEDQITPRSALRHRPIHPGVSTEETPLVPRASRGASPERMTKQTRKPPPSLQPGSPRRAQRHWLFFVGIGMLLALALVVLGHVALNWISITWDDVHYGRPRTYQVDAFVGHETTGIPSHFIALNLHGRIEIVEFPGGDATHARVYLGPQLYGDNADLVPVTLQFVDTRHDHHPDMVVVFGESHIVFRNEQGTFRPST
jgi:hypothetical protein